VVMSFVDAHDFPAGLVLRVLGIAESTYYDWRARRVAPSRRELDDAALLEQIVKVRAAHEFAATYGSPRVWLELRRQGVRVGRKRVERIMRTHGLQGAHLRRGWRHGSTRQNPNHTAAPDLVDRDFRVEAPNRLWVADLTRLVTGEGVLWLATVRDAFANRIVGWATDPRATTALVLTALNHALRSRDVRAGQLIHHSDKGAQYTALRFTQRLVDAGVAPSTGSTGDSFDNALAENLWSTIKIELVYWPGTTFATRAEAEHALIRYIDGWYNPRRIQAGLDGLSPDEYEDAYHRHTRSDPHR
jgi:putative transposase